MKPSLKHPPKLNPKNDPEMRSLANFIGEFIEYWGFKAVQGRMWAYLYLAQEPLNSRQLSELLEISPALVTQSVQVLLRYRVILEAEKGTNGVLRFVANPSVSEAIATVLEGRELALMERVAKAQEALQNRKFTKSTPLPLDQARIEQVGQWVKLATLLLHSSIASLKYDRGAASSKDPFTAWISAFR